VVKHALFWLKDNFLYSPELIVILQPTSPFLMPLDIDSSIQMLLKEKYESVVSITEAEYSPYWMVKFGENNRIEPIINSEYFYLPYRQGLPKAYRLNGAIYATFPSTLEKYPDLFHPRINMGGYIMPPERSFDINTEFDLNLARAIINVFSLG
jgi:CMP-N-acetylneuraminic acid synthetase